MPNGIEERAPGTIIQDALRDVGEIVQGEIRLAKAEMGEKAQKAGKAGGYMGGAALCGLLAAACLTTTFVAAMATAMPLWLAALLMCLFLTCAGAALYHGGRLKLKTIDTVPHRTVQTMRENLQWAKQRMT
jgi:hypothetical protein